MQFKRLLLAFVILSASGIAATPAQTVPGGDGRDHITVPGEKTDEQRYKEMVRRNESSLAESRPKPEDRVIRKGLLAPSTQDIAGYRGFLNQKDKGLIRLLPREIYDWQTYHMPKRLNVRGGGAYYSFLYLTHEYGYASDLSFDHGTLSVRLAGYEYGMLSNLGDVPLQEIGVSHPAAAFMLSYEPPRSEPEARCEARRFRKGVETQSGFYKSDLPVQVNRTYLLRSVHYGDPDVLVVFRIVRQDTDGSIIIPWKLLKQYEPRKEQRILYVMPMPDCPPN
jgi:hypothetical protein